MIVKNEEANLGRCLASVQPYVDEMVIVDTGSSDNTKAIAEQYGAKVYDHPWQDDFATARNVALSHVSGDWVLVLDADETLTEAAGLALRDAITQPDYLVINLLRQEIGAKDNPYSEVSRLFRRHPALRFSHPYHAQVDDSVIQLCQQETHWRIVTLPLVALQHTGYQPEMIAAKQKLVITQRILEKYLKTNPQDSYSNNKLAALYIQIGQVDRGIHLLEKTLQLPEISPSILYEIYYHLGNGYWQRGDRPKAIAAYQQAIAIQILPPLQIGAYHNLGCLLLEQGEYDLARTAWETVLQIDPDFASGYYHLGLALSKQQNYEAAIACYQQTLRFEPENADAYRGLGVAYLQEAQLESSKNAFRAALALYEAQKSPQAHNLKKHLQEIGFPID